jgi:hypothetical protein
MEGARPGRPGAEGPGLSLRLVSARRYCPGLHRVTLQFNGQALATRELELTLLPA